MIRRQKSFLAAAVLWGGFQLVSTPVSAFNSVQAILLTAAATVGGTSASSLVITAQPLPNPAFFGKNIVISVQVTANGAVIDTTGLTVAMIYQLVGPNGGAPLGNPITVLVTFPPSIGPSTVLNGTAVIPVADIKGIQNGGQIYYVFQARQGGAGVQLGAGGLAPASGNTATLVSTTSFLTAITNVVCYPVGPSGAHVSAPDLFENDGRTSVTFPAGSLSADGTICIKRENTDGWPLGPGRTTPVEVYTITLDGTSLTQTADLALSYPTDENGKVLNLPVDPNDLAIFWLGPENLPVSQQAWRILGRPTIDTTKHTVGSATSHFSTFALFVPGASAASASGTRPAERIITPNGDGVNDTITFSSLLPGQDEVRIFDIRGRRIRQMSAPGAACGGSFCWDGKDDSGSVVESGVYIYQYTSQGERVSGVVGVAK